MTNKNFGRPFKKGQPGGPGRKPLTEEQKELKKRLKSEHGKLLIAKFWFGDFNQVMDTIKNKNPRVDEMFIARIIERGIKKADLQVLEFIFRAFNWFDLSDEDNKKNINISYNVISKKDE